MTSRRYYTPQELAAHLHVKPATLAWWRKQTPPRGPMWKKFGSGVRYPVAEVEKYERDPEGYEAERARRVTL